MKRIFLLITFIISVNGLTLGQVDFLETFSDGDFTSNPVWSGSTANWQVVTSSDVSTGATNSYTLRLNAPAISQTDYLSTQYTGDWGTSQSWSFWLGRRAQAATNANHSIVWLWANESNLISTTVDGYRIRFGDDTGNDEIVLQVVTNGVATDILTSSGSVPNGLTDIGFMVRVTRTSGSVWTIYTSVLPTTNGTGAVASNVPDATSTNINQGSTTNSTYTNFSNGYFGVAATHSTGSSAVVGAEFDQIFFDNNSSSSLPVQLSSFVGYFMKSQTVKLEWETVSEVNNFGFYVEKFNPITNLFATIEESFQPGAGTTLEPRKYFWIDQNVTEPNPQYRLKQVDNDGLESYFGPIMLNPNSVDNPEIVPAEFKLYQNYPNPFNPKTSITFTVSNSGLTTLKVYNILGNEITTLYKGFAESGKKYEVEFDASNLTSGIYFYKLSNSGQIQTKKMLLIK